MISIMNPAHLILVEKKDLGITGILGLLVRQLVEVEVNQEFEVVMYRQMEIIAWVVKKTCKVVQHKIAQWSSWSEFGDCSTTCGGGTRTRKRFCNNPAPVDGLDCPGIGTDFVACATNNCPASDVVNGQWGPWSLTTTCSKTCGSGIRTRKRSCTNPAPANGGSSCKGDPIEENLCEIAKCPVDGSWSLWSIWSSCSSSCEGGNQIRQRFCNNPATAYGGTPCNVSTTVESETQLCNNHTCPNVDGLWGEWKVLTVCSRTCNGGQRVRFRKCNNPAPLNSGRICPFGDANQLSTQTRYVGCNLYPCPKHGGWSLWSTWTSCTATCGSGTQFRQRSCNNPTPYFGGLYCKGDHNETTPCQTATECSTDGGWSTWEAWSMCSKTCGLGVTTRIRKCDNPTPQGLGAQCSGNSTESDDCTVIKCPATDGKWGLWSAWSNCDKTCGEHGLKVRIRSCNNPSPSAGGKYCSGKGTTVRNCTFVPCPKTNSDGKWADWSIWSWCSKSCGGGQITRSRTCTDPVPSGKGKACDYSKSFNGNLVPVDRQTEIKECAKQKCPVDGQWSEWAVWSRCSVLCGAGEKTRRRACDNPKPINGGRSCKGAGDYSDAEIQTVSCQGSCPNNEKTTTKLPPGKTNPPFCKREEAYDNKFWPQTDVGNVAELPCPSPLIGAVSRQCIGPNNWKDFDQSNCQDQSFNNVLHNAYYVSGNDSLRLTVMKGFTDLCIPVNIKQSGDIIACKQIFQTLLSINFLTDSAETALEKQNYIDSLLTGLSGIFHKNNKKQWDDLIQNEKYDKSNVLLELTILAEEFGEQLQKYLIEKSQTTCLKKDSLEMCIELLPCADSWRSPEKPPTPTPPAKHIRGGYKLPLPERITHISLGKTFLNDYTCSKSNISAPERLYGITIAYKWLHLFMPNEKHEVVSADLKDYITTQKPTDPPIQNTRVVNSEMISFKIVSALSNTHVFTKKIQIQHFLETKSRDPICIFLAINRAQQLFGTEGCHIVSQGKEDGRYYVTCQCNHTTTFGVLSKPGVETISTEKSFSSDPLILFTVAMGLIFMVICVIMYFLLGIFLSKHFYILNNMAFANGMACAAICFGSWTTDYEEACLFITFMTHWGSLASFFCCWMEAEHVISTSYFLPIGLLNLICYVLLLLTYRIMKDANNENSNRVALPMDLDFQYILQLFMKTVISLILSTGTWLIFPFFIPVAFFVLGNLNFLYFILAYTIGDLRFRQATKRRAIKLHQLATKKKQEEKIASLPSWLKSQKEKALEEKRKGAEELINKIESKADIEQRRIAIIKKMQMKKEAQDNFANKIERETSDKDDVYENSEIGKGKIATKHA
ncbi:DgyrCDS8620 [Dimorphilus gyrociliatus]|uniref:DgyrCDS8620 n=1 Tax=Dimorphilus gyrociliatus TaxID=2664684 RepID=A0A7I8VW55_9ANNE|nr:DgyrCDS8620 [Dimorphilus gyrociliatus]